MMGSNITWEQVILWIIDVEIILRFTANILFSLRIKVSRPSLNKNKNLHKRDLQKQTCLKYNNHNERYLWKTLKTVILLT